MSVACCTTSIAVSVSELVILRGRGGSTSSLIVLAPTVLIRWMMSCRRNTTSRGDGMFGCAFWFAKPLTSIDARRTETELLNMEMCTQSTCGVSTIRTPLLQRRQELPCYADHIMSEYRATARKHCMTIDTSFCGLIDKHCFKVATWPPGSAPRVSQR